MKQEKQILETKRLLKLIESKTTDTADTAVASSANLYVSQKTYNNEKTKLFMSYPQLVGFAGDLKQPGSFFRTLINGVDVIAVRDSDMVFRAYANYCRHRGVILEKREAGTVDKFSCAFHKWTYSTRGELVGSPWRSSQGDSCADGVSLLEFPAVERAGLLWVYPSVNANVSAFDSHVDQELLEELQHFEFDKYTRIGSDIVSSESNWKLGYDTFGESHHFKFVHKTTLGAVTYCNSSSFQKLGKSGRVFVPRVDIDEMAKRDESTWSIAKASFPVYRIFPNSIIVIGEDTSYLIRLCPVDDRVDSHAAYATFYSRDGSSSDADVERIYEMMEKNPDLQYVEQKTIAQLFTTILRDEDYAPLEDQQKSASLFGDLGFIFEKNEPALHHFYEVYGQVVGAGQPKKLPK